MPPDIPTPNVDGVTQRVSVLEIEGGIQASYTTLGEGPRKEHISQFEIEPWGEVIVDDGKRIELRHEDGRYLAWVSRGGPGPMTIQICIWEQDPPDSTCPAP